MQYGLKWNSTNFIQTKGVGCPALDVDTKDRADETIIENIPTKEECLIRCKLDGNCKFWTWFNENSGQKSLDCVLMEDFGDLEADSNSITANANCNLG